MNWDSLIYAGTAAAAAGFSTALAVFIDLKISETAAYLSGRERRKEEQRIREEQLKKDLQHAAELAGTLNENHLRTVRDVSSLLGENAAEMQILLRELKEAILPAERTEHG